MAGAVLGTGVRMKVLIAIPVYNEEGYVDSVLDQVVVHGHDVLVIDDGSTDLTACLLRRRGDVLVLEHQGNLGYGQSLVDAFDHTVRQGYDVLVTMDCDGQHEPCRVPEFVARSADADILSGSRYLTVFENDSRPPPDRRCVNRLITARINRELGLDLTDGFCGFKAYRAPALARLHITDTGYAMPLQVWVQAARLGLRIKELAVPCIYLDPRRAFGGALDDTQTRLAHYHHVLDRELARPDARRSTGDAHDASSPVERASR